RFQPDWSGTYPFSFQGQAVVQVLAESGSRVVGQQYDATSNTTTGEIVVPKGVGLLIIAFTQTRRTPSSPAGSGIRALLVMRPGYPLASHRIFTTEFVNSLKPFSVLRYMNRLDTNHDPGYYG